jgi:hypothetical protein
MVALIVVPACHPIRGAGFGGFWDEGFPRKTTHSHYWREPHTMANRTEPETGPRPEWAHVAVTTDLQAESRALAQLAWEFRQEARGWTHPEGKRELERIAEQLTSWGQESQLESSRGDYWTRLDALQLAMNRRRTAQLSLRQWWQRGELWNSHRLRAVPAIIRDAV